MAEVSCKGSLPHGWIVKASKRYPDRIYYFNVVTGSSTWECPQLDPPRVLTKESQDAKDEVSEDLPENSSKPQQLQKVSTSKSSKVSAGKSSKVHDGYNHDNFVSYSSNRQCNEHFSFASSDDSFRFHSPPTAIVNPVVHKDDSSTPSIIGKSSCSLQYSSTSKSNILSFTELERRFDELDSKTSSKVKKKLAKSKKKRNISPLDKTDSELKKSLKGKKARKKCVSSKKKCADQNTRESLPEESPILPTNETQNNEDADDIEMLDVSMEIIEDLTSKTETVVDTFASYYIVVDTNVLISELHLINELKDTPVNGCGPPHIFIPWIVIQELDKLKRNRSTKTNTIKAACKAVCFLNSVLGNKHPRFHGQSPAESQEWSKIYSECNDDRILECCMGLADKMPQEKVILLTNDKNLVNKALICNINVHNWASMMESVKPDVVFDWSSNKTKGSSVKETNKRESEASKASEEEEEILQSQRNLYSREIHTVMCTARQLLKNVVSKFLEEEMHAVYGRKWVSFHIERKLLEGMLEAITRFWGMVFSKFMSESDKKNFQFLYIKAKRPAGFLADKEECLDILSTIETVFKKIKKRRPKIKVPVEKIQEFRVACIDVFNTYCKIERAIEDAEKASALQLFEKNWAAINQLCGMILDYSGIEHDFEYDKPNIVPSEPEFRQLICNLYPGIHQLKTAMFNILEFVRKSIVNKNAIKKFSTVLLQFIPSLEIPYEPVSYPHFSSKALEKFCYCPENREMMEIGYKQIENFYCKLDLALAAMMSSQFKKRRISTETMICD